VSSLISLITASCQKRSQITYKITLSTINCSVQIVINNPGSSFKR